MNETALSAPVLIVVPVFNEAAVIATLLAPLQAGRGLTHNIVVVDGGSTDATVELCTPMVDTVLVGTEKGRAAQMNCGASAGSNRYLWFLHADTQVAGSAVSLIAKTLALHHWGRFDVRFDCADWPFVMIAFFMNWRSRLTGIATGDQGLFMRRESFQAVGGFPSQALMEDIEICRRLKRVAKPVCLRSWLVTSSRRWQRDGVWRTILLMWRLRWRYFFGATPGDLAKCYRDHG